ncbi:Peptidase M14, carboxypeptidase A [uncultured Woeseiaceae bacterium]|uniref:Peptidase M14, carboxypeptidase A n=1 Tax=uncultured Woeseiaceae bacterium TaxID=1983305 RepID=A0A7D9H340_9GAMM|nr:Peptidase M14, carboxypeptidase A [uncultured Woeseiaceae bacterium]
MRLLLSLAAALIAVAANAQQKFEYWPNADYDPSIPTIETILGYAPGERITWHKDALRYFNALETSQPDRVSVHHYASSWEGRELVYVVISSAENMRRIDDIKRGMQSLRNAGDTSRSEANRIIQSGPAVTWLSYGVHGDEISSTDASMLTAYHLMASRGDSRVNDILRESVVVIDPMQNPDGRDRFIHGFEMAEGLSPDPDRLSAEHEQPWPSGRFNHYLFDMNRDWFTLNQPESRGRVVALQEWYPVVVVDLHEMGGDSTYYFAPGADPVNPHFTATQVENEELFGKTNAAWFDEFGIDYFTNDVYDNFYAGYGSSWPAYFGSIVMTYEQAGVEGLTLRQYDGNELRYAETVRNHLVTSLGTAETVANNRQKFLQDFYDYQVSAIAEGRSDDIRVYIIPRQSDQAGANKMAGQLVLQGVSVGVANAGFRACGENYSAGSYVIDMAQPAKRLVRTLLDANVAMDNNFLAEQEHRREIGLESKIYDVTAWSVPLMMNVRAEPCNRLPTVNTTPAGPELVHAPALPEADAKVAYLVPWGEATAIRFLSHALLENLSVKSSDKAFTLQGERYPAGTLIVDIADNSADVHQAIRDIASVSGANVVAVDDSWVTDGPNFGSNKVVRHNKPDVAIAWDAPTYPPSAGQARFVIERQFDYPVTAIRTARIATADLSNFEVLILPEAFGKGYGAVFGEAGTENLREWVTNGGVLIALGSANRYLADANIDLMSIRRENAVVEEGDEDEKDSSDSSGDSDEELEVTVEGRNLTSTSDYENAIAPESALPDSLSGVLLRAEVDPDHWLAAGVASSLNVLARNTGIYTPIRLDSGVNVARFSSPDKLLASGYIWEENRIQLAYKPFAVVQPSGRGFVIAFTQDPTIRAYLDGLNVIFMNAIFRGAAHARPLH